MGLSTDAAAERLPALSTACTVTCSLAVSRFSTVTDMVFSSDAAYPLPSTRIDAMPERLSRASMQSFPPSTTARTVGAVRSRQATSQDCSYTVPS